eukprot:7572329-Lingulodinium_polyedra.AAC.1
MGHRIGSCSGVMPSGQMGHLSPFTTAPMLGSGRSLGLRSAAPRAWLTRTRRRASSCPAAVSSPSCVAPSSI